MNLWVDDLRPAPADWDWAQTYEQAIEMLSTGAYTAVSLDHDLAEEHYNPNFPADSYENTGYTLLKWMLANEMYPEVIGIHTANSSGRANMKFLMNSLVERGIYLRSQMGSIGQWTGIDIYFKND